MTNLNSWNNGPATPKPPKTEFDHPLVEMLRDYYSEFLVDGQPTFLSFFFATYLLTFLVVTVIVVSITMFWVALWLPLVVNVLIVSSLIITALSALLAKSWFT